MDKVLIRGLEVSACHGVKGFEKVTPQPFMFDADIYFDFSAAAHSDEISDTINYSAASKIIVSVTRDNCFNLIEKLAYECAYAVMEQTSASRIVLTVYKPEAPMKLKFETVGVTVDICRERAYLSIGSSMGDRKQYLDTAIEKLNSIRGVTVKKVSDYIQTEPYGGVAKNKFLNCAFEIETLLSPRQLLNKIHVIEKECERVRDKRWGDRTLDIDIVFFGKRIISEDDLIIPHPEYHKREFVLTPLKQIAPDFICPKLLKPLKEIDL